LKHEAQPSASVIIPLEKRKGLADGRDFTLGQEALPPHRLEALDTFGGVCLEQVGQDRELIGRAKGDDSRRRDPLSACHPRALGRLLRRCRLMLLQTCHDDLGGDGPHLKK